MKTCQLLLLSCCLSACSQANSEPPPSGFLFTPDLSLNPDGGKDDLSPNPDGKPDDQNPGPKSTLVISEVFPHGTDSETDPDFIELYNGGSGQVNLRGYKVRDDAAVWHSLPTDAVVPAGGYYVILCDDGEGTTLPGAHVAFKLGGSGDEAHLAYPDSSEVDGIAWGKGGLEVPKTQTLGRVPDWTGAFSVLPKPSRGKPNAGG